MVNPLIETQTRRRNIAARYGITRNKNYAAVPLTQEYISFADDDFFAKNQPFDAVTILNNTTGDIFVTVNDKYYSLTTGETYIVGSKSYLDLENGVFYALGIHPIESGTFSVTAKVTPASEDKIIRSRYAKREQ